MKFDFIASNTASIILARGISRQLHARYLGIESKKFSDGEIYIRVKGKISGKNVLLIASTQPPFENIIEFLLIYDAILRSGAKVEVIIPYLGYMRQDRIIKNGEALGYDVFVKILRAAGIKKLYAIGLHSRRNYRSWIKNISTDDIVLKAISGIKGLVLVSPDKGGCERVKQLAISLKCPYIFLQKKRPKHNIAVVSGPSDIIKGRNVVIVDDIIDTGGTIISAEKLLKQSGAKSITVFATHLLLSGNAVKELGRFCIIGTDTISGTFGKRYSVAPIIADLFL